jgi:hypothetical protein
MKKSILFLTILVNTHPCFSQVSKGTILLGGNVRFESYKGETQMGVSKVKTLDIAPNIGYFIINRLAIGFLTWLNFQKF